MRLLLFFVMWMGYWLTHILSTSGEVPESFDTWYYALALTATLMMILIFGLQKPKMVKPWKEGEQ